MNKQFKEIISVKNVSFSFNDKVVLEDVSFNVIEKDFLGLIGPNGSGKTTLLKLILGIYKLQKGSIKILGKSIAKFDDWQNIGYVSQKATDIDPGFPGTVLEVVSSGLKKNNLVACLDALKLTDVVDLKDRLVAKLSGGQQQRVLIARAIVSKPRILILDEPATGVDPSNRKSFYELLHKLNVEGITVVLVSHDTGTITKYVTKLACLNKKLFFHETHESFCKHAKNVEEHVLGHTH